MNSFFLDRAREWRAVADALRAAGAPEDDPALWVWREAAWCHLLFTRGRHDLIVARLKEVLQSVSGMSAASASQGGSTSTVTVAADLFEWLWAAVSVRHPSALACPAA